MILKKFFIHNWIAILYFNFIKLPFRQAIILPIDIYGQVRFDDISGTISIKAKQLKRGMIKIGSQGADMFPKSQVVLSIKGSVEFNENFVLGIGSSLICRIGGTIVFGKNTILGARNLVFCDKYISLGEDFLSSWDCQIMDTDTHGVIDCNTGEVGIHTNAVFTGNHVWIGNGVIINKGVVLPSNSIVASRSLCNKDYTNEGENCIFAGTPAKVVSRNKKWEL